jgi:two-component system, NtrC family, response regulator HydG
MQLPKNHILCVDDHEDSGNMMKFLLESWNYKVTLAGTAADGFRLAQSEPFDLYLLATRLPDASGFELCKHICGVPGHAPVVFISGDAYETDKQRGLQAGALAYLTKPLDFKMLEITLTRLLRKSVGKGFGEHVKYSRAVAAHAHATMG